MNRMIRVGLAGLLVTAGLAASLAPSAGAATRAGVDMPDTLQVDGHALVLNGIGVRSYTVFQVRGYVGGLYLARKATDLVSVLAEPGPKVLAIHYVHGASVAQLHEAYTDSSRLWCSHHACGADDKAAFEALLATIQPVKLGDVSTFVISDAAVQVLLNDRQVARLAYPGFGRVILESDLGPNAPSPELRAGLLGQGGE